METFSWFVKMIVLLYFTTMYILLWYSYFLGFACIKNIIVSWIMHVIIKWYMGILLYLYNVIWRYVRIFTDYLLHFHISFAVFHNMFTIFYHIHSYFIIFYVFPVCQLCFKLTNIFLLCNTNISYMWVLCAVILTSLFLFQMLVITILSINSVSTFY